jgi:hypothetical protein
LGLASNRASALSARLDTEPLQLSARWGDNGCQKHHLPHLHAEFGEFEGIFTIHDAEMIEGNLPGKQKRLVSAWMEIHRDELMANWKLSISGQTVFKVEPLK